MVLTEAQISSLIKQSIDLLKPIEVRLDTVLMANGKYTKAKIEDARLRLKRNYKRVARGDSRYITEFTYASDPLPATSTLTDAEIETNINTVLGYLRQVKDSLRVKSFTNDAYTYEQIKKVGDILSYIRLPDDPSTIIDETTVSFHLRRNLDFTGGFQSGFHVIVNDADVVA